MIRFWIREVMGWLLILLGLAIFYFCIAVLLSSEPRILEAPVIAVIGVFVFRGGIHLLKVAVAARIASRIESQTIKQATPEAKRHVPSPWDW